MVNPKRFEVYLVALDPTVGSEIRKTRPCVVVSPDEMNRHIRTVIVAPMTSRAKSYPTKLSLTFGGKNGQIALEQIRVVDKIRLVKKLGSLTEITAKAVSSRLTEMFIH